MRLLSHTQEQRPELHSAIRRVLGITVSEITARTINSAIRRVLGITVLEITAGTINIVLAELSSTKR